MKRFFLRLLTLIAVLALAFALLIKLRYGGGDEFPDRHTGPARLPESALELVAELPTPPGNIAVSADNRVFVSLHPEAKPAQKVVELVGGRLVPFPAPAYQDGSDPYAFDAVLSIRIDAQQRLWTLDTGSHGIKPVRLMAFDISTNARVQEFTFPADLAGLGSHFNDFQVSPDGLFVYIADASIFKKTPAIVVYDVARRSARRLLQNHPAVKPEYFTPVVRNGLPPAQAGDRKMELFHLFSIRPGVDSIALDAAGEYLYFAPVTNLNLSRVATRDLRDEQLSKADLAGRVQSWSPKTMSDGMVMDTAGDLYITDPEHSAIVVLRADKTLETLVQSERLRWPDGFALGPSGWLYVSCSALHQVLGLPAASVTEHAPYQVFRVKTAAPAPENIPVGEPPSSLGPAPETPPEQ